PHPVTDGYGEDLVIAKAANARPVEANMASRPDLGLSEDITAASEIAYWNGISGKSDPELFKNYLEEFPNGRFAKPAATILKDLEAPYWQSIASSADPHALKTYCDVYPDGRFIELARANLEKVETVYWNSISEGADPGAFTVYLQVYPSGRFAAEAKAKLAQLAKKSGGGQPDRTQVAARDLSAAAAPDSPATASEPDPESMLWNNVSASNNIDDVKQYLEKYPEGKFVKGAKVLLESLTEQSEWTSIAASSDPQVFKDYLLHHPRGKFVKEARIRIEDLKQAAYWDSISGSGNPKVFAQYLRQHSHAKYADEARVRLDELTETAYWDSIADSQTPDTFDEYLKRYPSGRYSVQAKAASAELGDIAAWNAIATSRNKDSFADYLKNHPNGKFATQAKARLDNLTEIDYWVSVTSGANPDGYAGYLKRYPDGAFAKDATARYNDQTESAYWNSISNSADPEQFNQYLRKYPNGQFVKQAKDRIEQQKDASAWQTVASSTDPQAIKNYLDHFPDGQFAGVAKARVQYLQENADWNAVATSAEPDAFSGYLKKYPNGQFAAVARAMYEEKTESAVWKSISMTSNPGELRQYLKAYPNGRFVDAAKSRLGDLNVAVAPGAASPSSAESRSGPTRAPKEAGNLPPAGKPAPDGVSEVTPPSTLTLQSYDFSIPKFTGADSKPDASSGKARCFIEDAAGVPLRMVQIPAGSFAMGEPDLVMERPQHEVSVKSFFIGEFEVTQAQWRAVARLPKVNVELAADPSYFKGDDLPVGNVSWEDAMEFCARLSRKTGRVYRLPAEAEWEYACRAGTTTPFAFGENVSVDLVNFDGEHPYKDGPRGERRLKPVPVGSLGAANAFGLFDMHGNALEWCSDVWHDNYNQAPVDGSSWVTAGDSARRVLRGGDWTQPAGRARSSARTGGDEHLRPFNWGFRVVMESR
ncbi:MAG TPA: formylglycine-generating enzyme family protein, partial [Blastocatellia bacterium]|nr:formylglycine-generating enzyme family protein [Blastocatellia bacterium]